MSDSVLFRIDDTEVRAEAGATLLDAVGRDAALAQGIVAAVARHELVWLGEPVRAGMQVQLVRSSTRIGLDVVRRTGAFVFQTAAAELFPELVFSVGQSLLGGWFFEVCDREGQPLNGEVDALVPVLDQTVREMVEADLAFSRFVVPLDSVNEHLDDRLGTKQKLLRTWPTPQIALVRLRQFTDIEHIPCAPTTRFADGVRVTRHHAGLLLEFPGTPVLAPPDHARRLFDCYVETRAWNRHVHIDTVGDLNEAILSDRIGEIIRAAEDLHQVKIEQIAEDIATRTPAPRIVCVAGPTSAGKTTFVRRLSEALAARGVSPTPIGLDDYYRDRDACPRDSDGELDFEALEALDLPLLREQIDALIAGRTVLTPRFDFVAGRPAPVSAWAPRRLDPDEALLIEGIHGLNPSLLGGLHAAETYRIFVDNVTQLVIDEHNRFATPRVRLLRRLVRDRRYRGTSAGDTILRWTSVQRGEWKHIFPYHQYADVTFNSALVYEPAVLKSYAWRYLLEIPWDHPARPITLALLRYLDLFVSVFPDEVPGDSLLREFIGGGALR
jgi:uridine kinase